MKPAVRSWGLSVLVWSLLLIPQLTLVHALSHALAPTISHEALQDSEQERHLRSDQLCCASCLAFAQLGAALPARFHWAATVDVLPVQPATPKRHMALQLALAFRARAPPVPLI